MRRLVEAAERQDPRIKAEREEKARKKQEDKDRRAAEKAAEAQAKLDAEAARVDFIKCNSIDASFLANVAVFMHHF